MVKLSSIKRFLVGVVLSVITTLSTVAQTPDSIILDVHWSLMASIFRISRLMGFM